MGKFFKDSYASTYAAKNVKNALDKLIDVMQSPEQVRKLVIGSAPKKLPHVKPAKISFKTPAKTPLWMETSASVAKRTHNADSEKQNTITPPSSDNLSEKKKTSSGGSRASDCSDSSGGHIPTGRQTQMWKKSLREYPAGGTLRPRHRQRSAPPQLEAGWSSVPCKSGDFDFAC